MMDDDKNNKFDGLYMNVAQTTRGIEPLLDTVFSFLRRKTDFFAGPPGRSVDDDNDDDDDDDGTHIAIQKVMEVVHKHAEIYRQEKKEKKENIRKQKQKQKQIEQSKKKKKEEASSSSPSETAPQTDIVEMGEDGGFDASPPEPEMVKTTPPNKTTSQSSSEGLNSRSDEKKEAKSSSQDETTASKTPRDDADADADDEGKDDADDQSPSLVGNGGTVEGKYTWTQTLEEISMVIPMKEEVRGRDLQVTIGKKHLKVGFKNRRDGPWIVDAPLTKAIICDDSFWTVEDRSRLVINLQKVNQMEWWDAVCEGDPTIDVKQIQPENSRLNDLDGETRQTVEKMMFDQRQKSLGLPSSDEQKKMELLEKFKKQHPEMDFSKAKFT